MHIRVVRFSNVSPDHVEQLVTRINESDGPPPGVTMSGMKLLFDPGQGTALSIQEYATAEDMAEAAAVWIPPGKPEMTNEEKVRFATLIDELVGQRASELNDLFDRFDEHHPQEPSHYYLSLWGTHRDSAGRGVGTALIRDNLARIDAEGMPAYLESTNPANLPRYETLGFARTGEFGPVGGPVITTMWREGRATRLTTACTPM